MKLRVSGGVDVFTLVDERGHLVCAFAACDEDTRQVARKMCAAFNAWNDAAALRERLAEIEAANS